MTGRLTEIWRFPIKSHGRERVDAVVLTAGRTMAWDRRWAVAHEAAKFNDDDPEWVPSANFSRGSKAPRLTAINAQVDEASGLMTLTHPDLNAITFNPDDPDDADRFIKWVTPISPADRALPTRLVAVPMRGMTDTPYPSMSLMNMSSHRAVEQKIGRDISHMRWRINLTLEGLAPWEEFDWIGKRIRVGTAELEVRDPIVRCMMTTANPENGVRDTDTLGALQDGWGHQNFGVYAEVVTSGDLRNGDDIEVLG